MNLAKRRNAMNLKPRFTQEDYSRAYTEWGANCGPGAIAAILHMTFDEIYPYMEQVGFVEKRYTSPAMMRSVLKNLDCVWKSIGTDWPSFGLVRIQWGGPWTAPGEPLRSRYRHTHWVGAARKRNGMGIFDINCINNGTGWVSLIDWNALLVPWLLKECEPEASGMWHVTHSIEVDAGA